MTIRPFSVEDTEAVTQLLATSLTRSGGPEWFRWKHVDNPFGASPGFVAVLDDEIVAARFFLRWEFVDGKGTITKALRPVDTVTHPKARGQGIFKRLTLHGLEELNPNGEYLIFNTPNGNSLPGYLKMGWQTYPEDFRYYYSAPIFSADKVKISPQPPTGVGSYTQYPSDKLTTHKTPDFLSWRYRDENYSFAHFTDGQLGCLTFRLIKVKGLTALSIADYVGPPENTEALAKAATRATGSRIMHYLGNQLSRANTWAPRVQRGSSLVAVRTNRAPEDLHLNPSAGDLESIL